MTLTTFDNLSDTRLTLYEAHTRLTNGQCMSGSLRSICARCDTRLTIRHILTEYSGLLPYAPHFFPQLLLRFHTEFSSTLGDSPTASSLFFPRPHLWPTFRQANNSFEPLIRPSPAKIGFTPNSLGGTNFEHNEWINK